MQEDAGPLLAPAVGEQDQEVEGPEEFRGGSLFFTRAHVKQNKLVCTPNMCI